MKRKLWIILALAALIAALCCGTALADDSGSCGDNVTWTLNTSTGTLTVSGTGAMADYDMSGNLSPFARNAEIQTVNVEEGVTSIGYAAFYGCSGITEVSLPESMRVIGGQAFRSCSGLGHITLPNGLDSIGTGAFSFCRGLTSVTLPDSLTAIDTGVFINCSGLTSVSIPGNVVNVGSSAFTFCSSLTSVTFHNPDTVIGADAFTSANASLTIYGWLGSTAQTYAQAAGINFGVTGSCGDNVTWAFNPVTGALSISGTGEMTNYEWDSDIPWYSYRNVILSATIADGVTSIGTKAFYDCTNLTSVTIPNGVTSIGVMAFYKCSSLTSVTIPDSVTYIGFSAFNGCSGLTSVTIPEAVTSVGYWAFRNCTGLTNVTILNPGCTIGDGALDVFQGCPASLVLHGWSPSTAQTYAQAAGIGFESLGSIAGTCGDNVTWTFDPATGAMTISGSGRMASFNSGNDAPWYNYRERITSVSIGSGVTNIGAYSFMDCTDLSGVTIPDSVNSIGGFAFCNCTVLKSVTIPRSITGIYTHAFSNCGSLISVTIPGSVNNIESYAFDNCKALAGVTIMKPTTLITASAFTNCPNLTIHGWVDSTAETYANNNSIPFESMGSLSGSCGENVTYIFDPATGALAINGTGAMANYFFDTSVPWYSYRDSITSLTFDSGLTSIGMNAFWGCTGLSGVTIPDGVTTIYRNSFYGCTGLTDVIIPASVTTMYDNIFRNCSSLTSVTIQNPNTVIGNSDYDVFKDCASGFTLRGWAGSTAETYAGNTVNPCGFDLLAPAPDFFLPAALTDIESEAFSGIAAQAVVIPKNIQSISGNPFAGSAVQYIYGFPGTAAETLAHQYASQFTFLPLTDAWYARLTD